MSVKLEKDHRGRKRYRVSRYWPDGTRFRRFMPNRRKALHVDAKIHAVISDGSWARLKARLERGQGRSATVAEFAQIYRDEYCKARNRDWKRKWSSLKIISAALGKVPVAQFRPVHLHRFVRQRKTAGIDNGTINRDLTTLKHMIKYAKQTDVIRRDRIRDFPKLRETIRARPKATPDEISRLISHLPLPIQSILIFMRETGCRLQEALTVKRAQVRSPERLVVFTDNTKSGKFRLVPLTDAALEAIESFPVLLECPYVFWRPQTRTRYRSIYRPFYEARKAAGLDWLKMKDLRQYFAIDLAESGADMKDIQKVLGHSSVRTTEQYYAKYSPHSAARRVLVLLQ
ncbi:MAG TPA: site-specific integrase [Acidobacteriota bacterium]